MARVLVSIILGAVIIGIGVQFRSSIQSAQDTIIGWMLIATGIDFAVLELSGRGRDHDHDGSPRGLAAVMVPLGAAASPDLTILPVFLAAGDRVAGDIRHGNDHGAHTRRDRGGYEIRGQWPERRANVFTALVLIVIGLLVLTGSI